MRRLFSPSLILFLLVPPIAHAQNSSGSVLSEIDQIILAGAARIDGIAKGKSVGISVTHSPSALDDTLVKAYRLHRIYSDDVPRAKWTCPSRAPVVAPAGRDPPDRILTPPCRLNNLVEVLADFDPGVVMRLDSAYVGGTIHEFSGGGGEVITRFCITVVRRDSIWVAVKHTTVQGGVRRCGDPV